MQQRIISDGYGMRGKSKWIVEAIESFLKLDDYQLPAVFVVWNFEFVVFHKNYVIYRNHFYLKYDIYK